MTSPTVGGFHVVDYVVFAVFLVVSLLIGLYHACHCFSTRQSPRTVSEFLVADRRLSTLPVAISMFVSLISGVLVLGHPAEVYTRGVQFLVRSFGHVMAGLLAGVIFVPLFFRLRLTSAFEYLEWRFNSRAVKLVGTITNLISTTFQMGIVMYAPAIALEAVCGLPLWASITSTAAVAIIYTTLGGMKAVIWTDVFQAGCMIAGMLAIIIQGAIKIGGFGNMWRISEQGGRTTFFDFDLDPTKRVTFWSAIFGGLFSSMAQFGIGQTSVQRYCALPHLGQAKLGTVLKQTSVIQNFYNDAAALNLDLKKIVFRALFISCFLVFFIYILATFVGLVIYAYYAGCDPLRMRYISSSNQLVPYFIMEVLNYPGLPGAFLAVLFGGALSTMSSSLNSAAAVTWQDILKQFFKDKSESTQTWITKLLVFIYGVLGIGLAFGTKYLGKHVVQVFLMVIGTFYGPTLGIFSMGAFFPFANAKGALAGGILSTVFSVWMVIGNFLYDPHHQSLPTRIDTCNQTTINDLIGYTTFDDVNTSNAIHTTAAVLLSTMSNASTSPASGLMRFYGTSFLLYPIIGCANTLIIGLIVSLVTGGPEKPVDSQLLIPIFNVICPCLPASWRHRLQCNVRYDEQTAEPVKLNDKTSDRRIYRPRADYTVNGLAQPASFKLIDFTKEKHCTESEV